MSKLTYAQCAVEIAKHEAADNAHGYCQAHRAAVGTGSTAGEYITLSDGTKVGIAYGDRDCSSLAIECYAAMGIKTGGAWYTGDMRSKMCGTGNFKALPASTWRTPQPGDLLLNSGKHVAVAIGDGKLVEAAHSETGGITGAQGDQTGSEIRVHALYDDNWDCVLRYCGPERAGASSTGSTGTTSTGSTDLLVCVSGSTYRVNTPKLYIRKGASTYAEKATQGGSVAYYTTGDTVNLDGWTTTANGYLWGRYTTASGYYRYVAIRKVGSTTQGNSGAATVSAKPYVVKVNQLNVRKGASVNAVKSGTLGKGATVDLDGWSCVADGYVWGRYTSYSGYWRYIAVGTADGKSTYAG